MWGPRHGATGGAKLVWVGVSLYDSGCDEPGCNSSKWGACERAGDSAVKSVAVNDSKINSRLMQELYILTNKWCNVWAKKSSLILARKQFKNDIGPCLVAHRPRVGHLRVDFDLVGAGTVQAIETSLEERRIASVKHDGNRHTYQLSSLVSQRLSLKRTNNA